MNQLNLIEQFLTLQGFELAFNHSEDFKRYAVTYHDIDGDGVYDERHLHLSDKIVLIFDTDGRLKGMK